MPDPSPLPDPGSTAIAAQTFSLARKGYDPDEVRTFLEQVQAAVRAGADAPSGTPAPEALIEAQRIVAAAREHAEGLLAGCDGPDGAADEAITLAVREADEIIGAASARVDALKAEQAAAGDGAVDRWGDLGGHVARVLQQAEEEAVRIEAEAEAAAAGLRSAAAQDRAAAAEVAAQAQAQAQATVAAAETEVATLVQQAEPRVDAHLVQVRAQAAHERAASEAALGEAISRLAELQGSLHAALAEREPTPGLPGPLHFLVAPPAAPSLTEPDGGPGPTTPDGS